MRSTFFLAATFLVAALTPAGASTYTFTPTTLSNPLGDMGLTHTFTALPNSGSDPQTLISLIATAINISASGTPHLYGKQDGADETGLGLTQDSDHEITTKDAIQLDFSNPQSLLHVTSAQIQFDSVQSGEGWAVYGSNTSGIKPGHTGSTLVMSGSSEGLLNIPNFLSYKYYTVTATAADIALEEVQIVGTVNSTSSVPEPNTIWAGTGLIGLALGVRKVRGKRK